ncbi:MAG: accessory gene regulator B family protein [Clostridia bacterium]|jgi:accessory gene regulator B|nr:accessory gene regulator B family protein [Clostridia bacterium]
MSYSRLSTKASDYLAKELSFSEEKQQILAYSLDMLFLMIVGYIVLLLIGWLFGIPLAMISTLLSGDVLRKFSGGSHFSTPYRCLLATAVIYTSISWLSVEAFDRWNKEPALVIILIILCLISIFLVSRYAPVDSAAKPIVSPDFRKRLRMSSIMIVLLFSAVAVFMRESYIGLCIAGGITAQSITLLPIFNKK